MLLPISFSDVIAAFNAGLLSVEQAHALIRSLVLERWDFDIDAPDF